MSAIFLVNVQVMHGAISNKHVAYDMIRHEIHLQDRYTIQAVPCIANIRFHHHPYGYLGKSTIDIYHNLKTRKDRFQHATKDTAKMLGRVW